jgi:lactate permease
MNHNLPISLLSWAVAFLPMAVLLILLIGLRWLIVKAGLTALVVTVLTSLVAFQTPFQGILVALARGAWNSVEIILVILIALLLYRICLHAGAFEAIKNSVTNISKNYLFLVLLIGWVFTSFLQGISGFGTPVAIVAPMLVGLGIKPAYAVIIPLISQGWSNLFGALGIAWTVTTNLVNIPNENITVLITAALLAVAALLNGFFVAWLYARWEGIKEGWLPIVVASLLMGIGQIPVALWNPLLGVTIPAFITLGVMLLFTKMDRFKESSPHEEDSNIIDKELAEKESSFKNTGNLSIHQALFPFYLLTALSVIALGIPSISNVLSQIEIPGFNFPAVETGFNYVTQAAENFSPITIFTNPAIYLLVSAIVSYFWYKSKGGYQNTENLGKKIRKGIISSAISLALAIITFLMMSQLILISGQNVVLALGISAVTSPLIYAALSPWIGVASVFMTSSTVAGNTLFVPIQQNVVQSMQSLSMNQIIANQSAGGSIANAIGPSNIALGVSTTDAENETSTIYKYSFIYVILTTILFSVAAVLMHLLLPM